MYWAEKAPPTGVTGTLIPSSIRCGDMCGCVSQAQGLVGDVYKGILYGAHSNSRPRRKAGRCLE